MILIRSIIALSSLALAVPLGAQVREKQPAKSAITVPLGDSLDLKPSPELQKALDELGAAVQALALRVANDPQLRAAALQVATGFVVTAQQVVTDNAIVIQEALKTAADRIATVEATRKGQTPKRQ